MRLNYYFFHNVWMRTTFNYFKVRKKVVKICSTVYIIKHLYSLSKLQSFLLFLYLF